MSEISSIERVTRALNHQESDRVPMDFGVVAASPETMDQLYEYFKVNDLEDILKLFHIDIRKVVYYGDISQDTPFKKINDEVWIDHWGVTRKSDSSIISHPLKDIQSIEDIEAHPIWPTVEMIDLERIVSEMEKHSDRGYSVFGGMWACFDHICQWMLGMEKAMTMMIDDPLLYTYLIEKIVGYYLEGNKLIFEKAKERMHTYLLGNDFGTQLSLLYGPDLFRKFVKPQLKKLFDLAKEYGYYICLHSCGAIEKIIPDLIEIGLDCLDPIQTVAAGMDINGLKDKFGSKLCLHGGISTQTVLPNGSVEEVREEVLNVIKNISRDGGYILSPSQDFLPDIPVENIKAMYEVGYEISKYDK